MFAYAALLDRVMDLLRHAEEELSAMVCYVTVYWGIKLATSLSGYFILTGLRIWMTGLKKYIVCNYVN